MITPEKAHIEIIVVKEIKLRLQTCKLSKKWLACNLNMDYGKIKRILNEKHDQQLSLTVADHMLRLLGSNLQDIIALYAIDELTKNSK
ncbi:hypothetical protein Z042_23245 [Chania multitudinisentens RB-25]|uniref:HTH cro/C1-type domain-containing protein n=1 Tax=Chania multitudinisentens RB-25 TaxID=1441930 RepID=W0LLS4_9GAMM|nr:hypothetical protein [Chania multitudinisentens]AHG23000.1 hypothetical protein Z042_23245 [Chania multitudinisentens RB-25]